MSDEAPDNSSWHALVKYKDGGKREIVPIIKIKERVDGRKKRKNFNPRHLQDFHGKWYSVLTKQDSIDGEETRWSAMIGKLGETRVSLENEVENGKRIVWPVIPISNAETESSSTAVEESADLCNRNILQSQQNNMAKKRLKKGGCDANHAKLLKGKALVIPSAQQNRKSDQDSDQESDPDSGPEPEPASALTDSFEKQRLLQEIEDLKRQLKAAEDNTNGMAEIQELRREIVDLKQVITTKHDDTDNRVLGLEKKLDNYISKCGRNVPDHVLHWIDMLPGAKEDDNIYDLN